MPTPTITFRERKKAETRRAISLVALELATEHGPQAVTVDDIAAAANVSTRTVFNHFGTKDEAILGIDPDRRALLSVAVVDRPVEETPLEALAAVLTEAITSSDEASRLWLARARLVHDHPQLRASQVAAQAALELELAGAVATRTGLDAGRDLYPRLVATSALSALRLAQARTATRSRLRLRKEITEAFALLATGLAPSAVQS